MRLTLAELQAINPRCLDYPDYASIEEATLKQGEHWNRIVELTDSLTTEFSGRFDCGHPSHCQDSAHCAGISLPDDLIKAGEGVIPCIRVSRHAVVLVITVLRRVSPLTIRRIEEVAERHGFYYTPEWTFGEPFDQRDRMNGDLFNQLYDYI